MNWFRRRNSSSFLIFLCFLVFLCFSTFFQRNETEEKRIRNSLRDELIHLEFEIRQNQKNLTESENRINKMKKIVSKLEWNLRRAAETVDFHRQNEKQVFQRNSFDFRFESQHEKHAENFRIFFRLVENQEISDENFSRKFQENLPKISNRFLASNRSQAAIEVFYFPLRPTRRKLCYKNFFKPNEIVLFEFVDENRTEIEESCFDDNFIQVQFFPKFDANAALLQNDLWRQNSRENQTLILVFLDDFGSFERKTIFFDKFQSFL